MATKYICEDCGDVFKETQAHEGSTIFDKKFLICPNCHSPAIKETEDELSEFYSSY